ncbi:hypothetical protein BX666DRAFT_1166834 [Dichotomocladium elegans]|nr:hypothetical protein BX666DRAFT_1166834 [Dichotomocladium elegans]
MGSSDVYTLNRSTCVPFGEESMPIRPPCPSFSSSSPPPPAVARCLISNWGEGNFLISFPSPKRYSVLMDTHQHHIGSFFDFRRQGIVRESYPIRLQKAARDGNLAAVKRLAKKVPNIQNPDPKNG